MRIRIKHLAIRRVQLGARVRGAVCVSCALCGYDVLDLFFRRMLLYINAFKILQW